MWCPWFVLSSGCPEVRLGSCLSGVRGRFLVWDSPLKFVLILRGHDVGAGSVPFVLDLQAFCASGGFVSVLGVGAFLFSECDY